MGVESFWCISEGLGAFPGILEPAGGVVGDQVLFSREVSVLGFGES